MLEEPNIEDILRNNPSVNIKDLEEIASLMEDLRKLGIQPRGYQLAEPFSRRRANAGECDEPDPRTINLTSLRY